MLTPTYVVHNLCELCITYERKRNHVTLIFLPHKINIDKRRWMYEEVNAYQIACILFYLGYACTIVSHSNIYGKLYKTHSD